jgi:prepilin-type N-terminal cleavage/methylation domain-containing protein
MSKKIQIGHRLSAIRHWTLDIGHWPLAPGFSLIEMVVAMGLLLLLLGFITLNLVSNQRRTSLEVTVEALISDLRAQQIKAMTGATGGSGTGQNFGIYFASSSYTLFRGNSYSASDTHNLVIALDPNYVFANAGQTVSFTRRSGMVIGYQASQNTIVLQDATNNDTRTITFNQYGVPVALDK